MTKLEAYRRGVILGWLAGAVGMFFFLMLFDVLSGCLI